MLMNIISLNLFFITATIIPSSCTSAPLPSSVSSIVNAAAAAAASSPKIIETVKDALHDAKHFLLPFLQSYGYLRKHGSFSPEGVAASLLSGSGQSDTLRDAIRLMQKWASLPQTGVLDVQTLAKLTSPRCGLPDIDGNDDDDKQSNRRRVKRFEIHSPDYRWRKALITWQLIRPSYQSSSAIPPRVARQELKRAFDTWSRSSGGRIRFEEIFNDDDDDHHSLPPVDISIGFYSGRHSLKETKNCELPFDGPGRVLAHAYFPTRGDIHFDDAEQWTTASRYGQNLYLVALHEIGHSLGFSHTSDRRSIMYPYYSDLTATLHGDQNLLHEVDQRGLRYLYGGSGDKNRSKKKPQGGSSSSSDGGGPEDRGGPKLKTRCLANLDTIASIGDEMMLFKGVHLWRIDPNTGVAINGESNAATASSQIITGQRSTNSSIKIPERITDYFVGFPAGTQVDAAYESPSPSTRSIDQKDPIVWLYTGKKYYRFTRISNTRSNTGNSGTYQRYRLIDSGQLIQLGLWKVDHVADIITDDHNRVWIEDQNGQYWLWNVAQAPTPITSFGGGNRRWKREHHYHNDDDDDDDDDQRIQKEYAKLHKKVQEAQNFQQGQQGPSIVEKILEKLQQKFSKIFLPLRRESNKRKHLFSSDKTCFKVPANVANNPLYVRKHSVVANEDDGGNHIDGDGDDDGNFNLDWINLINRSIWWLNLISSSASSSFSISISSFTTFSVWSVVWSFWWLSPRARI